MSRSPVTIAIPAWNCWATTRACLDSLRPTLSVRDQVIVVDNGSTDATPGGLRMYPWVQVVTNDVNRGFAGACNDGARLARHDVVVFLHNDTLPGHRWCEPLVTALAAEGVVGAGPCSDFAGPDQAVPDVVPSTRSEAHRFARSWAEQHRGRRSASGSLSGFCLAVRRDAFERAGGFDEGYGAGSFEVDDLCQKLRADGGSLVVCGDSFVHHEGRVSFTAGGIDWWAELERHRGRFAAAHPGASPASQPPLVSGCVITKDEEAQIEACLRSLDGIADEVVVYDTGSTDRTVEIARSLGAEVIEGYWDDDFSRARNSALARCRGEWIAWLDADETLEAPDPLRLRHTLAGSDPDLDGWSVRIQNLTGAGAGSEFTHRATRLFRRRRCEWAGRLHEQVARRRDHAPIQQQDMDDDVWLRHTGYLQQVMHERGKVERNLRVAQAEVANADGWDRAFSLTSLGRSMVLAGRHEEAIGPLTESLGTDNGITKRLALRSLIDANVGLGRFDEALRWCDRYREEGGHPNSAAAFEADALVKQGRMEEALAVLDGVQPGLVDGDGFRVAPGTVYGLRSEALAALGRFGEAADQLLSTLHEEGALDAHIGTLVDYFQRAGRPLDQLAAAIPAERVVLFLAQILQLDEHVADSVLEACTARVDPKPVLAAASRLAIRLPVDRALVWSARLRAAGYGESCPLVAIASSGGQAVLRARAAATAAGAFADTRAPALFERARAEAGEADRAQIDAEASQLCPSLLSGGLPAVAI